MGGAPVRGVACRAAPFGVASEQRRCGRSRRGGATASHGDARRRPRTDRRAGRDGGLGRRRCDKGRARGERSLIRWPPLLDRRRLVAGLMAEDGSTIVTIADGAKAGALVRWLVGIGRDAVLLRGDDSAAVRTAAWRRARSGGVVVAGGRLAALAPVPDLRAAIVVDDADEALKEERVPAWHARDLLDERARRAGARYVILSAAPTLDSIASVGEPVTIPRAVEAAGWPRVDVVDRRADPPGSGLFSEHLAAAIRHCLAQGQITVCVLNRRGRARLLACGECGKLVRRDRSGAPLWSTAADAVSSDRAPDGREPAAESRAGTGGSPAVGSVRTAERSRSGRCDRA
ncbi:MAG: hypothetical protein M5T61_10730 [Acidimicrobiia bacterium]|nr:hypothetical protein [Acidimicrobiia bacterium]